jgi:hypothetical protein
VSKGSVASGRSERVGVPACGRIGVMSGSRLGCERLSGLVLIMGLQRMGSAFSRRRGSTARRASMGRMRFMGLAHHGLASEARSRPPVTPILPQYRRPEHRWSG